MTDKTLTIKLTYTDGTGTLGTDIFDIGDDFEDKIQKRGKALGAKFARTDDWSSTYNIKYDDKHTFKRTEMDED